MVAKIQVPQLTDALIAARTRLIALGLCLAWSLATSNYASSQGPGKPAAEQIEFGSDSSLDRPVPVPPSAVDCLRKALGASPDELSGDDLKASEIQLHSPAEVDLVIPRLVGGHAALFYVLRPAGNGYQLLFDSGGDALTVLPTRSHGYRDLRVWGFSQAGKTTTTTTYRFNGRRYAKVSEKTEGTN